MSSTAAVLATTAAIGLSGGVVALMMIGKRPEIGYRAQATQALRALREGGAPSFAQVRAERAEVVDGDAGGVADLFAMGEAEQGPSPDELPTVREVLVSR